MAAAKRQYRRSLLLTSLVCSLAVLTAFVVWPRYRRVEWKTQDLLQAFGRRAPAHPDLVFLAIDNTSANLDLLFEDEKKELPSSPALTLMKEGWPYPRSIYPLILDRLVQAGAAVVALDIVFRSESEHDAPFREALERHKDKVVIGTNLEQRDIGGAGEEERFSHTPVKPATTLLPPIERGMDSRVGFVNFWPDPEDGVVRRAIYRTTSLELDTGFTPSPDDAVFSSFATRVLEKSGRADLVPSTHEPIMMRFIEKVRPLSLYKIFMPRFWDTAPLNGGTFFRDKIVIVGPDGNWVKDELKTPLDLTNGPRIHLSALNAALTRSFINETPGWMNWLLILSGGAAAWALGRFISQPLVRLLVLAAVIVAGYGAAQLVFNYAGWLPVVFSPLVALAFSGVTFSVIEQVMDRLEKARLRRTFERYVSRDVVKELVDNPEGWLNVLGGQRRRITLLFSDVRGFTTLTEAAGDEQKFVAQLNEYFDEMVRIVFKHHGTLDKFIGDAVMAHWGSIVTAGEKTDACRAVATALEMKESLIRLNEGWKARGMIGYSFGIGINHGDAIVGNLGSEEKREVSAIGDAVNLASRLEGATKEYHTDLLIGEKAAPLVRDCFFVRTVDLLQVKGKTKPVEVFTVVSERENGAAEPEWLASFEEGVRLYRQREFVAAASTFREASKLQGEDWLTEEYVRRAEAYIASPPGPEWNGVYVMTKK